MVRFFACAKMLLYRVVYNRPLGHSYYHKCHVKTFLHELTLARYDAHGNKSRKRRLSYAPENSSVSYESLEGGGGAGTADH